MGDAETTLTGPDLAEGIAVADLKSGEKLLGHAGGEAVLLARVGDDFVAIGATCTHYGGPLAEGMIVGDTVRCPWHHACFSLRTGEALAAPALNPVACWRTERRGDRVVVTEKVERDPLAPSYPIERGGAAPNARHVVIVGAGAAGSAAAEMLRRCGFDGRVTVVDEETASPYDRPNLSKDYLAGNAPEEWIPLRPDGFYAEHGIDVVRARATRLDPAARRLDVEGFIGLEAAASLRARELDVHVVAPETVPLERVMGRALGDFIRALHEEKGVQFHLGRKPARIEKDAVVLDDGTRIAADLVVIGVGVRPRLALAEQAGLTLDKGVVVDEQLRTSAANVWAAGDIARWPDPHTGERIRVEHWVVAQRMGQAAARNILGAGERFDDVPFFWSAHYDVSINYVGHAERWDGVTVDGDPAKHDVAVRFDRGGKALALATIFRDEESLAYEVREEDAVKDAAARTTGEKRGG